MCLPASYLTPLINSRSPPLDLSFPELLWPCLLLSILLPFLSLLPFQRFLTLLLYLRTLRGDPSIPPDPLCLDPLSLPGLFLSPFCDEWDLLEM